MKIELKPDWNTAPDWAQWWAINPDGMCFWSENKPKAEKLWVRNKRWDMDEAVVPNWRETLQRRPKPEDASLRPFYDYAVSLGERVASGHLTADEANTLLRRVLFGNGEEEER